MNIQFLLNQDKQLIAREFLVHFFAGNKIYILIFTLETFFRDKITVIEAKIKMFNPNFLFDMSKQENIAFDPYNCFQIKNKYVELVGSEKMYQKLNCYQFFTLIESKCDVHPQRHGPCLFEYV